MSDDEFETRALVSALGGIATLQIGQEKLAEQITAVSTRLDRICDRLDCIERRLALVEGEEP
jgi:hypothetical protein